MNVATEIVEAIHQFEGRPLLRLTYDNTRRDRKMVESLDTYIVLNEIAKKHRIGDATELRTQIMIEYSKLQSGREFFSDETTSNHYSLVLFTIFNVKFDLNYANTDKLAEEIAGMILTAGTTFPIKSATVLGRLFETYHEFGVDAEGLKAKINISLQNQYNIFRTDESFRDGLDEDHHSGESILEELDIDMVQDFPHEHLHLTGLGVGRKLVQTATINPEFKLSNVKIQRLDSHTKKIKEYCPRDFPRKPRSVKLSARKATEFSTFDAYTGPVLFLNILRPEQYHHFLAYSVAIRILSTPGLCTEVESNTFAHKFLVNFVQNSVILYGESFVSFNVHGLIHLAADIMRFGPLMDFSAFPFENHLQGMKKTIRKSQKPLHQYVRRVKEFELNQIANEDEGQEEWFIFKKQHYTGPVLQNFDEGNQFKQAFIGKRFLSRVRDDKANCCVLLNDNSVVVIENFLLDRNKKPHITGKTFTDPSDFLILLLFRLNLRFYKFIRFRNCQKCPKFGR